jgi:uncharacterized protein (TIGR03067 family)
LGAMKTLSTWAGAAVLLAVSSARAEDKPAEFDPAKLVGDWTITAGEKNGEKVDANSIKGTVTFTKDTITIKGDDGMTHVMGYKIVDPKKAPVAIDMTGKEGPATGLNAEGIVSLEKDTLKLCYGMPGQKRPTEFAAKKDGMTLYFTLTKKK